MKNIVLLMAFVIFALDNVFSNESILSKLHQHTYKVKDNRMELMSYNKDFINFFEIKPFKYNRTTTAHNITVTIKVNIRDKTEVVVQLYKFLSNEYRPMAVRFQVNLQKAYKSNAIGLRAMSKCGNVTLFDFYKDITYHVCNFMIDETQLPPLVPIGRYKVEFTLMYDDKEIALINDYGEIYIPIVYPKNK